MAKKRKEFYNGLTKEEIIDLPTIHGGPFDDLKCEDVVDSDEGSSHVRVWVSRIEVMPDGSSQCMVEKFVDGEWEVVEFF